MYEHMKQTISELSGEDFWLDCQGGKPDYRGIWIRVIRQRWGDIKLMDLQPHMIPNPSSFQRLVAYEAQARRGHAAA